MLCILSESANIKKSAGGAPIPSADLIEILLLKELSIMTVSPADRSRLPTDSIRIIHENARLWGITVCCHRSGKRREKGEPETFYFIMSSLSPPFNISFQLTKKVPSFKNETWKDVLIHLFPGTLCTSSLLCLCSVTLSQCGTSLPLGSAWDQTREMVCQQQNENNMEP